MEKFLTRCWATFFFTGHFPVAPATFASLVTLALWWLLPPIHSAAKISLLVLLALSGTFVAGRAEAIYGHDAKPIVIDEALGALLTVAFLGHNLRAGWSASSSSGFWTWSNRRLPISSSRFPEDSA